MKKVTLITGYYYPEDTAIGLYNSQLVEYLECKGYTVCVVTGFPNYPQWRIRDDYKKKHTFLSEKIGSTKVYRYKQYVPSSPTFFKRILLIFDFTFGSLINIFKIKKTDIIICVVPYTTTIFLGWLLKLKTSAIIWNHVQDFEFDAAKQTGVSKSDNMFKKIFFNVLFKLETFFLNKGCVNSTISLNMLNKLEKKSKSDTFYFPNWIDQDLINPENNKTHKYLSPENENFKILYSGNIGDKQDWDSFFKFTVKLDSEKVDLIIVGDGSKKDWLLDKIKDSNNIKYYKPVDYKELSSLLCSTDLHVLFQKQDVVDSVMPSKLLGMMASAKPSLILGNASSEVKNIINESNGGFYISNNDLDECVSIVKDLIDNPEKSRLIGANARKYIVAQFSKERVLSSFETKLSKIIGV
ncbi:glycosyltransferase family 4 protein [Winogradskyella sp. R77965]|uniref:glycosyltransferase family 4 protein n=1 Tax=Winogradskyella sp. R77965 TaxID=3093872 RepID=UPI0037DDD437